MLRCVVQLMLYKRYSVYLCENRLRKARKISVDLKRLHLDNKVDPGRVFCRRKVEVENRECLLPRYFAFRDPPSSLH